MVQARTTYRARPIGDPGMEAAGLLLRIGVAILFVVTPLVVFFTRRTIVVLVPIGLTTIILASAIKAENFGVFKRIRASFVHNAGMAALFLCLWMIVSIAWTPVQGESLERLFKTLGTVFLAFAACLALPERMRAPNLNLIIIGAAASAIVALGIGLLRTFDRPSMTIDNVTLARASVMLAILAVVAIAWFQTRAQPAMAAALMAVVALAIFLIGSRIAGIVFIAGSAGFAIAFFAPQTGARGLGWATALALIGAPLLALAMHGGVASLLSQSFDLGARFAPLDRWGELIVAEPLRLLTGHGFDTAARARVLNFIPSEALRNAIFEIWYELGAFGALTASILIHAAYTAAGRTVPSIAPSLVATLTMSFAFAIVGDGVMQIWWLSSLGVVAVAFMAVCNGQHRTVRPKARGRVFKQSRELAR